MKKIACFLIMMLLSVGGVWAEDSYFYFTLIDGIYYQLHLHKDENGNEANYAVVEPQYYAVTKGGTAFSRGHYSGSLDIPESVSYEGVSYKVTGIGMGAFMGCTLDRVSIPETVESIYDNIGPCSIDKLCFSNWNWWCQLEAPSMDDYESSAKKLNLVAIANQVIVGGETCDMTNFVLPGGITSIRPKAFQGCTQIKNVTFPNDVRIIGDYAFEGCGLTKVVIPDNVEVIGKSCFAKNNVEEVIVGRNLREMGDYSFYSDSGNYLKVVVTNLAGWCENLSADCFNTRNLHLFTDADTEITDLVVPEGVTSVHRGCFNNVRSLKSVSIPSSVQTIGEAAFAVCKNLQVLNLAEGVKTIGASCFAYTGLTSVIIPNSVVTIEQSAFHDCDGLREVTMGDGVKTIGADAFSPDFTSVLEKVVFGKALRTIESRAFSGCDALKTIVTRNEAPWPFEESLDMFSIVFPASVYESATLYVPKECRNVYARTEGWRNFQNIYEQNVADGVRGVDGGQSQQIGSQYDLSGRRQSTTEAGAGTRKGIYIRNGQKYVVK